MKFQIKYTLLAVLTLNVNEQKKNKKIVQLSVQNF